MIRSVLAPAGPQAAHIAALWWLMFWVCLVILLVVSAALLIALWRGRTGAARDVAMPPIDPDPLQENRIARIVAGCVALTAVILLLFLFASAAAGHKLALLASDRALKIRLTGYRWWWKVQYPGNSPADEVITANEIHIPTGRPVLIDAYSQDVIHSFWVPALHGKRDLIPGHPGSIWLQADRPGRYEGQCAEFCGLQHAHMRLIVVAEPEEKFNTWLQAQREPAHEPADAIAERGRDVFLSGPCAMCHAVRGTGAGGQVAPDLTHLASRATLAAATLPNSPGNLAGWIVDPQHVKPGNAMPANSLSAEDLRALLAYLGGLH